MGMSLKAELCYGFPLLQGEDEDPDGTKLTWLHDEMFHEEEADAAGIVRPDHKPDYKDPEWTEYFKRKNALQKSLPCAVDPVGHYNDSYFVLTIRGVGFSKHARDDTAIVIPAIDPQWDVWLKQWCEKYEFTYHDPSWHLVPYYF